MVNREADSRANQRTDRAAHTHAHLATDGQTDTQADSQTFGCAHTASHQAADGDAHLPPFTLSHSCADQADLLQHALQQWMAALLESPLLQSLDARHRQARLQKIGILLWLFDFVRHTRQAPWCDRLPQKVPQDWREGLRARLAPVLRQGLLWKVGGRAHTCAYLATHTRADASANGEADGDADGEADGEPDDEPDDAADDAADAHADGEADADTDARPDEPVLLQPALRSRVAPLPQHQVLLKNDSQARDVHVQAESAMCRLLVFARQQAARAGRDGLYEDVSTGDRREGLWPRRIRLLRK